MTDRGHHLDPAKPGQHIADDDQVIQLPSPPAISDAYDGNIGSEDNVVDVPVTDES